MGLNRPLIYLDSCIIIYFVENHGQYFPIIDAAMNRHEQSGLCISPLVELECLVLPMREKNDHLLQRYEIFLHRFKQLKIPRKIFPLAAELRARFGLKTPDALHLATARHHGCIEFWTNDDRLRNVAPEMVINVLAGIRGS